ncbi:MAG TPA: hypothetical protein HA256_06760 [Methanoregulaceae archaeon]|nr:hypothetical protein [Methanoregulaceae archaeon]
MIPINLPERIGRSRIVFETAFTYHGRIVLYVTRTGTISFMVTLCRHDLLFFPIIRGASW